ncbi:Uncharacterised protein [Mycoplasmopsis synoviae]|uniref:Uncharacterized protein n=1 Tax=Mycoplasmopsis synoviae TaxID=2109 RepID=A0A3B0P5V7_MYCSY|nr:Uncharacterised protein [Mycoplasmopsis synoviae]
MTFPHDASKVLRAILATVSKVKPILTASIGSLKLQAKGPCSLTKTAGVALKSKLFSLKCLIIFNPVLCS